MKVIDISKHNGKIDFEKVKADGIKAIILRIGWIGNKNNHTLDTKFEEYYTGCKKANIPIGIYVFNYCQSEDNARNGAKWVIDHLKDKKIELPIYIDMEDDESSSFKLSSLGKDILTKIAITFNEEIEKAGYVAGVYANLNWFKNYLYKDKLNDYSLWIAHYGVAEDKYKGQYDILQYSSTGKVLGIKGNVDLDILYNENIINKNNNADPTPNIKKTVDEIAKEVINGQWGNADDRKKRLEEAGYNYKEVQNKVNEILGDNKYYPACDKKYLSIIDALKSLGIDSSRESRKKIAKANGINNYIGTAYQNISLLNKLKAGRLKKV